MAGVSRCAEHEELLSAYLDGQLDATELAVVVAHLGGCEECIAAFRHLKEARSAVRLLPSLDPPPGLLPGLHPDDALSAFLDGELLSAEADAVVAHVAGCAACRAELHELDAARIAVRALPRLEPAPPVPRSVPARTQRRRVALAAAGVAMALAVGAVLAGGAAGPQVDRDSLATRHQARTSVESGFSVIPASFSPGGGR